jgi:hypothetical protein
MNDLRPKTESELVDYIRGVDVAAPASLRSSVDALVEERAHGRRRRHGRDTRASASAHWPQRLAALGGLAAVVAVVLAVALSGGTSSSKLTLQSAAAVALGEPTHPAPADSSHNRSQLQLTVGGVAFPYWEGHLGWQATGARSDRLGGRNVTTVFYKSWHGQQVGYAIVAGPSPLQTRGGTVIWRAGTPYRLLREGDAQIVTWTRSGQLCVIAGRGVSGATLVHLASTPA